MEFTQTTPSNSWTIEHSLNIMQPIVDVWVDNNGVTTGILPKAIQVIDGSSINISFSIPIIGTAVVNGVSTQSYIHNQINDSPEWHIRHNLGTKFVNIEVIVNYDGVLESIIPQNITCINNNQINVYFSRPFLGLVRVSK